MARVLIHAGMPRTGSSSIQRWLRDHGSWLRETGTTTPLRATVDDARDVRIAAGDGRSSMNSKQVWSAYQAEPARRREVVTTLLEGLAREAGRHGAVTISAESFGAWFWRGDAEFAAELNDLGRSCDVEIAYYVRPQHAALEAAWRARGFRGDEDPSEFLWARCPHLDHRRTIDFVATAAPRVRFTPRPFRRDLLAGGNVVVDFARTFLGVEVAPVDDPEAWRNRGLPLELANSLHWGPDAVIPDQPVGEPGEARAIERLRRLSADLDLPTSDEIRLSRLVLQQACHERFEPDNLRLIAELGWETDEWVPAVQEEVGGATFERLDELWRPRASAAELTLIAAALSRLIAADRARSRPRVRS